ncbi:MAG: alpha/beta fold hydrolase, partial [Chthoniobacterales bacterium]
SGLSEPDHADGAFPRPDLYERLGRVLAQIKPDVVFACYGMNDGIYLPLDKTRFRAFQDGVQSLHESVTVTGPTMIHITSPVYDDVLGNHPQYSEVLTAQAAWLLKQRRNGWSVIDVYGPMNAFLSKHRKLDPQFKLAEDGVHPGPLGHWLIAKEILTSLGFPHAADCPDIETLAATHPQGQSILRLITEREEMLRDSWLTTTGHKRPGLNPGLPLAQAESKARDIHAAIECLLNGPAELVSQWNGFQRRDFSVNDRAAILVSPKKALPGNPWIWRTEFFDAFPSVDIALLGEGYHVAYIDVTNLYGAPKALDAMDGFFAYLVQTQGLSQKIVLEGFSRGGLFALNWAARNPDKVAALYLDAPVCDFKSWPGGKGKAKCSPGDWESCLNLYGLSEEESLSYPLNPVDNLKKIAEAKIPIIAVAGDEDDVVPMEENINLVEKRYRELGGKIEVIVKPGVGHHPHSLTDPTPVVAFLLEHAIKPTASQ